MPRSQEVLLRPSPGSAIQAYVDSILPFARCFVRICSLPGPEHTVLSTGEAIPAVIWLTGLVGETYSEQPITQFISIMMKTTIKGGCGCQERGQEEGQT